MTGDDRVCSIDLSVTGPSDEDLGKYVVKGGQAIVLKFSMIGQYKFTFANRDKRVEKLLTTTVQCIECRSMDPKSEIAYDSEIEENIERSNKIGGLLAVDTFYGSD